MLASITFLIASQAFAPQASIPAKYTCEGQNISPPLTWSGAPSTAKSLALIVNDKDAFDQDDPESSNYVHWILYNIPVSANGLPEAAPVNTLPKGTLLGKNDENVPEYKGPCPPSGKHRYYFKLYALDTVLPNLQQPTEEELLEAMKGHIIKETELMGTYERADKQQQ